MPGKIQELIYKIIWDDGDASKKKSAWDRKLKNSSKIAQNLGKIFLKMGVDLGKTLTVDAIKNFAIFEDALGHARRTMRLSREETLLLGDTLMDLATSFEEGGLKAGVTANALAKIAGILGQLGFSAKDNIEQFNHLVSVVAKVGVAFGMSAQKAAEGLGILRNLYDLPVEKIENAASSIAYLGNTTVSTASEIMNIMQRMGGIAGLLGVTAQEAAALASTLREAGVRAGLAGTAMSQIFSRMASDVDRFGEVLKKGGVSGEMLRMKIESGKATEALKMVLQGLQNIQAREGKIAATQALKDLGLSGVRVQQTLLALSNNIGGLNKNLAASDKAFRENVAVNDAYQAAIDNTWQKMTQFRVLLDTIQKIIGKDLALAFSDFLEKHLIPFTSRFKDWVQTSKGAEAIFGRDGMIASGLDWIGQKLTDNADAIFDWLDKIDKWIPPIIQEIRTQFGEFLEETIGDAGELKIAFETLRDALDDIKDAINAIKEAWKETEGIRDFLKILGDTAVNTTGDIVVGAGKVTYEFSKFAEEIGRVTYKIWELGKAAVYGSVLPDIAKETVKVTDKTIKLGEYYEKQAGQLKNIYRTGKNTFSNLARDVQHYHDVFQNSGWKANKEVQYYLTQTGEAVGALGAMYQQTGEKAQKAVEKITMASESMAGREMMGFPETARKRGKAMTTEQWQNLSSDQIADLINRPGLFSASGIMKALTEQRMRAVQERPPTSQPEAQPAVFNGTIMFGDQEISRFSAVLDDHKQQENQRSFGGSQFK